MRVKINNEYVDGHVTRVEIDKEYSDGAGWVIILVGIIAGCWWWFAWL